MAGEIEARVEALEATIAHQDRTIEDLNGAIGVQWKEIEALKREVKNLVVQLRQIEANPALDPGDEPPPPHY